MADNPHIKPTNGSPTISLSQTPEIKSTVVFVLNFSENERLISVSDGVGLLFPEQSEHRSATAADGYTNIWIYEVVGVSSHH